MTKLRIYTDGACRGNQSEENAGGWGAVLEYGEHRKEIHGGERDTTNNRMEMTALLRAFEAVKKDGQDIEVFCDSSYLINCFRERWYEKWQRNGWRTAGKKDVVNRDLWEKLLPYIERHTAQFFLVKGHVDPDWPETRLRAAYAKFCESNGSRFDYEFFLHINAMNDRCDELANIGADECGT